MEALTYEWLLGIGILLIGIEALLFSFVFFPIGLGFVVVAIIEIGFYDFGTIYSQVATAFGIGAVVLLLFRGKFLEMIHKSSNDTEEVVHKGGVGVVDGTQIKFEGTYWNTPSDLSSYKDGERVNIVIVDNRAVIQEIE